MSDASVETDRVDGAPHPRDTARLVGHDAAEAAFLDAWAGGRLHHAWLLAGPKGVGKATLAWRIARFLLAGPPPPDAGAPSLFGDAPAPDRLDTDPDHPVNRRITARSEPGVFSLRRGLDPKRGQPRAVITVDEVRALRGFFSLTRPDGGPRVVIVDAADELNLNAANALLKMLEEPPAATVFLLVAHVPSRLLPTIRSRCRTLRCPPLPDAAVAEALAPLAPDIDDGARAELAALSTGSVGAAFRLHMLDGRALQAEIDALLSGLPGLDRPRATALAGQLAQRGADDRRAAFLDLMAAALAARARVALSQASDGHAARLWAGAAQAEPARVRAGLAVNLDPQSLILDMLLRIDRTAAECAAEAPLP